MRKVDAVLLATDFSEHARPRASLKGKADRL